MKLGMLAHRHRSAVLEAVAMKLRLVASILLLGLVQAWCGFEAFLCFPATARSSNQLPNAANLSALALATKHFRQVSPSSHRLLPPKAL